jgi:hypothetical protein
LNWTDVLGQTLRALRSPLTYFGLAAVAPWAGLKIELDAARSVPDWLLASLAIPTVLLPWGSLVIMVVLSLRSGDRWAAPWERNYGTDQHPLKRVDALDLDVGPTNEALPEHPPELPEETTPRDDLEK